LASNLEEEFEEYGLHLIFNGLYPDEDGQLEDEEPTEDIADFEEEYITNDKDTDEDLPGEVPNFDGEDVDYIDFLGSDNILNCNTPSPLRLGLSLFFFYNKIFAKIHKVYQST
jgi:hypothetical protein